MHSQTTVIEFFIICLHVQELTAAFPPFYGHLLQALGQLCTETASHSSFTLALPYLELVMLTHPSIDKNTSSDTVFEVGGRVVP